MMRYRVCKNECFLFRFIALIAEIMCPCNLPLCTGTEKKNLFICQSENRFLQSILAMENECLYKYSPLIDALLAAITARADAGFLL